MSPRKKKTQFADLAFPDDDPMTKAIAIELGEDHYLPRGVDLDDPKMILDLGANYGYSTWTLATKYPDAKIWAIEMDDDNCELIRENTKEFGDRVTIWNLAVVDATFDGDGTTSYAGHARTTYTVLPGATGETKWSRTINMQGVLATLDHVDYIKMDLEGAEHAILREAAFQRNSWLSKVDVVKIEVHEMPPSNGLVPNPEDHVDKIGTVEEITSLMLTAGFVCCDEDGILLTFRRAKAGETRTMGIGAPAMVHTGPGKSRHGDSE